MSDAILPKLADLDVRRRQLGMSRALLADHARLSLPTVTRVLTGKDHSPTAATLAAVAAVLGLQIRLGRDPAIRERCSVEEMRRRQATSKARRLARLLQGTMGLEAQSLPAAELNRIAQSNIERLLAGSNRRLWGK